MRVVCNIPFGPVEPDHRGYELTLVGAPDACCRWVAKYKPELDIIACFYWNIRENKTVLLVRNKRS